MTPALAKALLNTGASQLSLTLVLAAIEATDPSLPGAEQVDTDERYKVRNGLIYHAMAVATEYGYRCGIGLDPAEPQWPVAYIDLPTGQISWHLPAYPGTWDGHDHETKSERIRTYRRRSRVVVV